MECSKQDASFMSYKISDNERIESIDEDNAIVQDINDTSSELFRISVPTNGSFQLVKLNLSTVYHKSFH